MINLLTFDNYLNEIMKKNGSLNYINGEEDKLQKIAPSLKGNRSSSDVIF